MLLHNTFSWDLETNLCQGFKPHISHLTLLYSWTFSWKEHASRHSLSLLVPPCLEVQQSTHKRTEHIKLCSLTYCFNL